MAFLGPPRHYGYAPREVHEQARAPSTEEAERLFLASLATRLRYAIDHESYVVLDACDAKRLLTVVCR